MKLKRLVWVIYGLFGCLALWLFVTKSYSEAVIYFLVTLVLLAASLDVVRAELAALRRTITAKDEPFTKGVIHGGSTTQKQ